VQRIFSFLGQRNDGCSVGNVGCTLAR
jgi:hypothetical protein